MEPVSILLSQGKAALAGLADVPLVAGFTWCAHRKGNGLWYAVAYVPGCFSRPLGRSPRYIAMHTLITGWPRVDHRDRNGLNNTRLNLREAADGQNHANPAKRKRANASSRFKGVSFTPRTGRWAAGLTCAGRHVHLGYFDDERDAARAYDDAAPRHFGEFALTNSDLGLYEGV